MCSSDLLTVDFVSTGVGDAVAVLEVLFVEELFVVVELFELVLVFVDALVFFVAFLLFAFFAVELVALVVVLALALVLELALAAGAAACVALDAAEVVWLFKVAAEAPAIIPRLLLDNCGGVTDKTAPRPPTVPPAINNARFIPFPYPRVSNKIFEPITELNCPNLRST